MTEAEKGLVEVVRAFDLMSRPRRRPNGFVYHGPNNFLVEHAKLYAPRPLPPDGMDLIRSVTRGRRLKVKHCFQNAANAVFDDVSGRLAYCEGYAIRIFPVHHAWVLLDGEIVVDLTWNREDGSSSWKLADKVIGEWDPNRFAYYGVAFSTERLRKAVLRSRMYDSLLYANDLSLMREPFDPAREIAS